MRSGVEAIDWDAIEKSKIASVHLCDEKSRTSKQPGHVRLNSGCDRNAIGKRKIENDARECTDFRSRIIDPQSIIDPTSRHFVDH